MTSQDVRVRVLGFREDDMWCAIALEMDLRGYGDTPEEARQELFEAIGCQISFAIQHDNLDNIWVRAPEEYFEMFRQAERDHLRKELSEESENGDSSPFLEWPEIARFAASRDSFDMMATA